MTLGISATALAVIGTTLVTSAVQYDAARDARKAQQAAQAESTRRAREAALQADQEFNRLNMKKPNIAGLMAQNQQATAGGIGSTMLTGPRGAQMANSILGKTTLLGG